MATKTEEFLDREILNDHLLEDYKQGFYSETIPEFNKLERKISRILKEAYGQNLGIRRRNQIIREIQGEIQEFTDNIEDLTLNEMEEFSDVLFEMDRNIYEDLLGDIELNQPEFHASIMEELQPTNNGNVMSMALLLQAMADVLERDTSGIVKRMSLVDEDESQLAQYYDSTFRKARNNLNVFAVTAVAITAGSLRNRFFNANRDHIRGFQYVAVMDNRTTPLCQSLHTGVWYYDQPENSTLPGEYHPPLHPRCRSTTIPIFVGETAVDMPTYQEWFNNQPEGVQREVLGPARYQMYVDGDISFDQFYTNMGRKLTLNQLREIIQR